jgi:hypothetical protein
MMHIICISSLFFQDWSGIVDQSQAGGDQYHVGDFIYVMPAESTGNVRYLMSNCTGLTAIYSSKQTPSDQKPLLTNLLNKTLSWVYLCWHA